MDRIKEKFLVIVKPGFCQSASEIRGIFEYNGFDLVSEKKTKFSEKIAKQFYANLREKPFYQEVIDYMTSDQIYVMILKGFISDARGIVGPTDPKACDDWQIRAIYGRDIMKNAVHCSDSVESAVREIALIENLPDLSGFWGKLYFPFLVF